MNRFTAAILIVAAVLMLLMLAQSYGDPPVTLVETTSVASQPCRIHTLPSPCDGKCGRQAQRSIV